MFMIGTDVGLKNKPKQSWKYFQCIMCVDIINAILCCLFVLGSMSVLDGAQKNNNA